MDFAGGVDQTYALALMNFAPDKDKFTWHVSGPTSDSGAIVFDPLSQRAVFNASFPLAVNVKPGAYEFTLRVDATETSGLDTSETLSTSIETSVNVDVLKNPKLQP